MRIQIIATVLTALAVASCSTKNDPTVSRTAPALHIAGRWTIESIVFNDSDYVRPAECAPEVKQTFTFTDSTYFAATNCNSLGGFYTMAGDSIVLGDGAMTEMACDNMDTEDALRRILPHIATVRPEGDTVLRLCTERPESYILLRKDI